VRDYIGLLGLRPILQQRGSLILSPRVSSPNQYMSPSLPREIIYQILSNLPTRELCSLLPTSKAVYLDVTGILRSRLETNLILREDHKLIVLTSYKTGLISSLKRFYRAINGVCRIIHQNTHIPIQKTHHSPRRCTVISH
jgi:hypothetical protein